MGVTALSKAVFLIFEFLGCLFKKTDLGSIGKKISEYLVWSQEICLLNKQAQVILSLADFEFPPFGTQSL